MDLSQDLLIDTISDGYSDSFDQNASEKEDN